MVSWNSIVVVELHRSSGISGKFEDKDITD